MTTPPAYSPIPSIPVPQFPPHPHPRVWLLTSATSPLGIALARLLLAHGDSVVVGMRASEVENGVQRGEEFRRFWDEVCGVEVGNDGGQGEGKRVMDAPMELGENARERLRVVELDGRTMGKCQAAVAEAAEAFGRVDILFCCTSEAVIGTVEELAASPSTLTLVRDQFETNFFGPVNIIKAVLPGMRERKSGHIIALTGITGHLGTPGLSMYCAAGWALEGFCDSLAYEVAPFNIKITIVQPNLEIGVLINRITSAPLLPQYAPDVNPAPLSRTIIGGLLDRIDASQSHRQSYSSSPPSTLNSNTPDETPETNPATTTTAASPTPNLSSSTAITSLYPSLPTAMKDRLIAETVHALTAIGGHENPPARHIVGCEGVASVKEKLKTVSEELEDFVECSCAVDIQESVGEGGGAEQGDGVGVGG
ncbi:MAG: hypothetical protein FRX48_06888 [Lasallia pustulata]|uniref:NAD(P)-binding protein n=1 Tax=Lasallia pustulata TaxID=136370 RepID=A0A5M8PK74_9LECA|nr:MAG: hypothetical protein FRX48_06888 [Lasallia pustulata]